MTDRPDNRQIGNRDREGAYRVHRVCVLCGEILAPQGRGRPRKYCTDSHRKQDARALRKWSQASIDAVLAGLPEPAPWTWRKGTR